MIPYKSKVVHVEYDILNVYPIINNRNSYPRKENNFGNDSIIFILYDEHFGDTIIYGNTDISGNIII